MLHYDAIIIGAGHNGLVAAAYLAKARKNVLVLEQRPSAGGAAATEETYAGFKYPSCADVCRTFYSRIVADLDLEQHGLKMLSLDPGVSVPLPGGAWLPLWRDEAKAKREIERLSKSDATQYASFGALLRKLSGFLQALLLKPPPELKDGSLSGLMPLLELCGKYWGLGKSARRELFRVLPMSVFDFLHEWFQNDALKAAIGGSALVGNFLAPRSQGTALLLLYHHLFSGPGPFQFWTVPQGGMGRLSSALAQAAERLGAKIRTEAKVTQVLVKNENATGVVLESGEECAASAVVSAIGVKPTFLNLIDSMHLEPDFLLQVRNIRCAGVCAKVNAALSELPRWKSGQDAAPIGSGIVQIGSSLDDIERAFDDAKYGDYSTKPFLQVLIPSVLDPTLAPAGKHVASILVQYTPYRLKNGDWKEKRDELGRLVIDAVSAYAPNFKDSILHSQVLTPLDLEEIYGLPEGHYHHADMALDQLFFMRPVPGWARYRTPLQRLYLCGAGTHPGGGVTGIPGYNAAQEIIADRGGKK
ncbi:MAG: phytoene desaturase family protein [Candidatus Binatia bacterium]